MNMWFFGSVKGEKKTGSRLGSRTMCIMCRDVLGTWNEVSVGLVQGGSVTGEILLEEPW